MEIIAMFNPEDVEIGENEIVLKLGEGARCEAYKGDLELVEVLEDGWIKYRFTDPSSYNSLKVFSE